MHACANVGTPTRARARARAQVKGKGMMQTYQWEGDAGLELSPSGGTGPCLGTEDSAADCDDAEAAARGVRNLRTLSTATGMTSRTSRRARSSQDLNVGADPLLTILSNIRYEVDAEEDSEGQGPKLQHPRTGALKVGRIEGPGARRCIRGAMRMCAVMQAA